MYTIQFNSTIHFDTKPSTLKSCRVKLFGNPGNKQINCNIFDNTSMCNLTKCNLAVVRNVSDNDNGNDNVITGNDDAMICNC